jgi:Ca2+:H+ antiporter
MQAVQWSKHWMLVFVPIALVLEHVPGTSAPLHFLVAALGIVPIARLIGESTEHLAHYTGDSIGALLNTMFGNLPELIICVVALKAGLYAMVAASLVGAILFNLLLVLGLSFLLGGLRRHTLEFNVQAVRMYSTMMFIAVISLALPSIYEQAFAPGAATIEQSKINIGLAVLLLLLYGSYLLYMIGTHPEEFASIGKHDAEEHETHWSMPLCFGVLIGSSVAAAFLSEVLVGAVEGTGEALGLSTAFLGIVLLASVGGIAEGMSAITMARKGRFDLSLGIALGSCILIALFVAPVLVFASYFVGPQPFQLSFSIGGVGLLFLSVLIGAFVASGGSGNWYKGVQLIAVYLMIALLLYFVPLS